MRNSKFWGNSVYDIFLQSNSGPVSNVLIENNWFAAPVGEGGTGSGSSTLAFSGGSSDFANSTVRHNSVNGYFSFDDNGVNPAYSNFKVVGNIGQPTYGSCSLRGVIYRYNLWKGMACGTGDVNLSGAYPYVNTVNGAGMDYHLTGGVAARPRAREREQHRHRHRRRGAAAGPASRRRRRRVRLRRAWRNRRASTHAHFGQVGVGTAAPRVCG